MVDPPEPYPSKPGGYRVGSYDSDVIDQRENGSGSKCKTQGSEATVEVGLSKSRPNV